MFKKFTLAANWAPWALVVILMAIQSSKANASGVCNYLGTGGLSRQLTEHDTVGAAKASRPKSSLQSIQSKSIRKGRSKALHIPRDQWRDRAKTAYRGGFSELVKLIQTVERELKSIYHGRDKEIDKLITPVSTILLHGNLPKPAVVDFFGLPSEAKTSIARDLCLMLDANFYQYDVVKGDAGIPTAIYHGLADNPNARLNVLIVDEHGNFKSDTDLRAEAERATSEKGTNTYSSTNDQRSKDIETRRAWVSLMGKVYGNGQENEPVSQTVDSYVTSLETKLKKYRDVAKDMDAASLNLRKTKEEAEKEDSKDLKTEEIKASESKISVLKSDLVSAETELKVLFLSLKNDYQRLVERLFGDVPLDLMVTKFLYDSSSYLNELRVSVKTEPVPSRTYSYKKFVTVFTGNPNKMIIGIQKIAKANQSLSPDVYNRIVQDYVEENRGRLQEEMFTEIFGDNPALLSRMGANNWKFTLPIHSIDWRRLIESWLSEVKAGFEANLLNDNIGRIQLKIDSSVVELFYKEAVRPLSGVRGFYDLAPTLMGNFYLVLAASVVNLKKTERPREIVWAFDEAKREFTVTGRRGASLEHLVIDERVPVARIDEAPSRKLGEQGKQLEILRIVGSIVAGLFYFKSLPSKVNLELNPDSNSSIDQMWREPSEPSMLFFDLKLRQQMGGIDGILSLPGANLPANTQSHRVARDIFATLLREQALREHGYKFLVEIKKVDDSTAQRMLNNLFPRLEISDSLREVIQAASAKLSDGGESLVESELDKALEVLITEVHHIARQNQLLVKALKDLVEKRLKEFEDKVVEEAVITQEEVAKLISNQEEHYHQLEIDKGFIWRLKFWQRKEVIKDLITLEHLDRPAGMADFPLEPHFEAPQLTYIDQFYKRGVFKLLWDRYKLLRERWAERKLRQLEKKERQSSQKVPVQDQGTHRTQEK